MNIRVVYERPPIPVRDMDYAAFDDDRLDGAPDAGPKASRIGRGRTRADAIRELAAQACEDYSPCQLQDGEAKAMKRGDTTTLLFIDEVRGVLA